MKPAVIQINRSVIFLCTIILILVPLYTQGAVFSSYKSMSIITEDESRVTDTIPYFRCKDSLIMSQIRNYLNMQNSTDVRNWTLNVSSTKFKNRGLQESYTLEMSSKTNSSEITAEHLLGYMGYNGNIIFIDKTDIDIETFFVNTESCYREVTYWNTPSCSDAFDYLLMVFSGSNILYLSAGFPGHNGSMNMIHHIWSISK